MIGPAVGRKCRDIGIRVDLGPKDCLYMTTPLFGSMARMSGVLTRNGWDDRREVCHAAQGYAMPDGDLKIVDPEPLATLPPSPPGKIWARGNCNMLGHSNKPQETAPVLREDGRLRTGGLGALDETGRLGEGYRPRGFTAAPEEIERVVGRLAGVAQCAVVGVAYVVLASGAKLTEARILWPLRRKLASYTMPQATCIVAELPLTSGTGKVQKFKLREDALTRMSA